MTVRVNLVFFTTWLAPRLPRFYQEHPDIRIRFTSNIWRDDKIKDTDLDIRYGHGVWPGLKADRLTWDELFPVCSPELIKDEPTPLSIDLLAENTLLHVIGYEEGWGYWLDQMGVIYSDASVGIQFDTLISGLEMAVLGQGFALGRTSLVSSMIANGKLIAPFEEKIETSEAFFLTSPIHQYLHPSAETFSQWILQESQDQFHPE